MKFKTIAKQTLLEKFYKLPSSLSYTEIKSILGIKPFLNEATICAPVHPTDIKEFKELFDKEMPAGVAVFLISDLLNDDGLNSELNSYAEKDPYADARPVVVQWVSNNMPQLAANDHFNNVEGYNSVLGSQEFR